MKSICNPKLNINLVKVRLKFYAFLLVPSSHASPATPFQWPYPRSDAYQDIWGREMSIHANVGGMTAPALGSEYFNLRTPTSTSTKPRLNRSRKTGGPCLIRPHKGPCSRECPLTVGFTRLQNSHKRMAPRSLTVAVQIHLGTYNVKVFVSESESCDGSLQGPSQEWIPPQLRTKTDDILIRYFGVEPGP